MFSENLKKLRERKEINQSTIAELLNTTQQQYSRYENGTEMPYNLLKKIAIFYDTSTDYIIGLTDEIKPYKRKGK